VGPNDVDSPDSKLAVELLRLTRRCRGIDKYVSSSAALTIDEMHFLSAIYFEHPPSVKSLTELVAIEPTRASKILKLLEQKGFVVRSIQPMDHRKEKLILTQQGVLVAQQILSMFAEVGSELLGSWRRDLSTEFPWLLRTLVGKDTVNTSA
jgi:DNA-binding MarR family transcriptional regulator